jgi:hypothetical protein
MKGRINLGVAALSYLRRRFRSAVHHGSQNPRQLHVRRLLLLAIIGC